MKEKGLEHDGFSYAFTSLESYSDTRRGEGYRLITRVQSPYSEGLANEIIVHIPDSLTALVANSSYGEKPSPLNEWIIGIDKDPQSLVSRDLLKVAASIEEAMLLIDSNHDQGVALYLGVISNINTPFAEFFDGEMGWSSNESPELMLHILHNFGPSCQGIMRRKMDLNLNGIRTKAYPTILSSIGLYVSERKLDTGQYADNLLFICDRREQR